MLFALWKWKPAVYVIYIYIFFFIDWLNVVSHVCRMMFLSSEISKCNNNPELKYSYGIKMVGSVLPRKVQEM